MIALFIQLTVALLILHKSIQLSKKRSLQKRRPKNCWRNKLLFKNNRRSLKRNKELLMHTKESLMSRKLKLRQNKRSLKKNRLNMKLT